MPKRRPTLTGPSPLPDAPAGDTLLLDPAAPLDAGGSAEIELPDEPAQAECKEVNDIFTSEPPPDLDAQNRSQVHDPIRIVSIDLPLMETAARYAPRRLAELERRHADALRRLTDGLVHEGATLEGRPIRTPDDALAWLLEQLAR